MTSRFGYQDCHKLFLNLQSHGVLQRKHNFDKSADWEEDNCISVKSCCQFMQVAVLRLLKQLSQVYSTLKIEKLKQLVPFMTFSRVEALIVDAVQNEFIQATCFSLSPLMFPNLSSYFREPLWIWDCDADLKTTSLMSTSCGQELFHSWSHTARMWSLRPAWFWNININIWKYFPTCCVLEFVSEILCIPDNPQNYNVTTESPSLVCGLEQNQRSY